jgi:hypothetical protein
MPVFVSILTIARGRIAPVIVTDLKRAEESIHLIAASQALSNKSFGDCS